MKKVLVNYLYSCSYQLFLIIVPLITAPYLARTIGASGLGINSYVNSISQLSVIIGLIGLNTYSNRQISFCKNDKEKLNILFSEIVWLRTILCILTIVIYLLYSRYDEYNIYLFIQTIYIIASFLDFAWFFNALEDFSITVKRIFFVKTINIICIFLFIQTPDDLYKLIFLSAFFLLIGNLAITPNLFKSVKIVPVEQKNVFKHLLPSIEFFLPAIAMQFYLQINKILLVKMIPDIAEVAYFDQAEKIVKMPIALFTSLSAVMMPRLTFFFKTKDYIEMKKIISDSFRFAIMVSCPIVTGMAMIASGLIPWFLGDAFSKVIIIIIIQSPIILAMAISSVSGQQYFISVNQPKVLTYSYFAGAIINVIVDILLIPTYYAVGASIGMLAAEYFVAIIQWHLIPKQVKMGNDFIRYLIIYLACSSIMGVVLLSLKSFLPISILSTFLEIFVAIIIYLLCLFLVKDNWILALKEKFLKSVLFKK